MSRLEEITKEVIRVLGKYQTSVVTITDIETFHNYVTSCIEAGIVAIDTETNNSLDPLTCKLMGLCLYAPGLQYAYIPINHRNPETMSRLTVQLTEDDVRKGFANVCKLTGLMGRWQKLNNHPTLICDTGHNVGGINYIIDQLKQQTYKHLHIVMGMVNDKDVSGVLAMMPKEATYYFTKASVKRALDEKELKALGQNNHMQGEYYPDVLNATKVALENATEDDLIFVGGSSFIVADLLSVIDKLHLNKA